MRRQTEEEARVSNTNVCCMNFEIVVNVFLRDLVMISVIGTLLVVVYYC